MHTATSYFISCIDLLGQTVPVVIKVLIFDGVLIILNLKVNVFVFY